MIRLSPLRQKLYKSFLIEHFQQLHLQVQAPSHVHLYFQVIKKTNYIKTFGMGFINILIVSNTETTQYNKTETKQG